MHKPLASDYIMTVRANLLVRPVTASLLVIEITSGEVNGLYPSPIGKRCPQRGRMRGYDLSEEEAMSAFGLRQKIIMSDALHA